MHRVFHLPARIATAVGLLSLTACSAGPPSVSVTAPYIATDAPQGLAVERVVLGPIGFPRDLRPDDERLRDLEAAITHRLLALGFDVVPTSAVSAQIERLTARAGGFYDPITGELDGPAYNAMIAEAYRSVLDAERAHAVIAIRVLAESATYTTRSGFAQWCNTSQDVRPDRTDLLVATGDTEPRLMPATCLLIQVVDADLRVLYGASGGIETLARLMPAGLQRLPAAALYRDAARIRTAVEIATRDLEAPLTR